MGGGGGGGRVKGVWGCCEQLNQTSFLFVLPHTHQYQDLSSFLIARACRSTQLASYFYWYLSVECNELKDNPLNVIYERIRLKFLEELKHVRLCCCSLHYQEHLLLLIPCC